MYYDSALAVRFCTSGFIAEKMDDIKATNSPCMHGGHPYFPQRTMEIHVGKENVSLKDLSHKNQKQG